MGTYDTLGGTPISPDEEENIYPCDKCPYAVDCWSKDTDICRWEIEGWKVA